MGLLNWIFEEKSSRNVERFEVDTWKSWVEYEKEYDAMIEALDSQKIEFNR